jgi:flavin-dependent dehydrogenase
MLGRTATGLIRDGSRVAGVELDGNDRIRSRLVVAADGRDSRVAELARGRTKVKPHNRFGYFAYYEGVPLSSGDSAQLWLLDPDTAYAFPTDGGLTLLACMLTKDKLADFKRAPQESFVRTIESLPDAPPIREGRQVSKLLGKIDIPNVSRRAARPGLAFIGDAAMASDPLWGIGCGFALQSAEWLADYVGPALVHGGNIDRALRGYRRKHRAEFRPHHAMANSYATGRPFNPMERLLNSLAAHDQQIAARMSLVGERWIKPSKILTPRTLWRAIRVTLTPTRANDSTRVATTARR